MAVNPWILESWIFSDISWQSSWHIPPWKWPWIGSHGPVSTPGWFEFLGQLLGIKAAWALLNDFSSGKRREHWIHN
jgi:hypothetical protein